MEKLPQSVLKQLQGPMQESEPHPDPDLLTAFSENSLLAQERAPVIDHLAHCTDCRDILALAASALELPTQSRTLPAANLAPSPWFVWPAFRWAALAAGVLIVASVSILQFEHNRQTKQVASSSLSNGTSFSAPARPASEVGEPLPNDGSDAHKTPTASERSALPTVAKSGSQSGILSERDSEPAQAQLAQNQPVPLLSLDNSRDVVKAKNPIASQSNKASANLSPQSPVPVPASLRWAINAGVLQRSGDEGRSWQTVNPSAGSSTEFFAIAVNGADIWVGGSAGSLYHSRDAGTYWIPVTPSINGTSLTGNVIGIQFSDPQHASITTSTSEVWISSDAGKTWVKRQ
ncbi:MAG TPA: YCF48-related protein [Candidatus Sulfotelmatobacter sp.]|jgi:hypothetical protein